MKTASNGQELPYLLAVQSLGNGEERYSWTLTRGYEKIAQGTTTQRNAHYRMAVASVLHLDRETVIYVGNNTLRELLEAEGFTSISSERDYYVLQRGVKHYATRLTVATAEYFDAVEVVIEQRKAKETNADRKNEKLERLTVATDASMRVGDGVVAGIAWVAEDGRHSIGCVDVGTNNVAAAELWAIYDALDSLHRRRKLLIHSDSRQAINAIQYRKNILARRDKYSSSKVAALEAIDRVIEGRDVIVEWVKAHDGHAMNETADKLAKVARVSYEKGHSDNKKWVKVENILLEGIGFDNKTKTFVNEQDRGTAA